MSLLPIALFLLCADPAQLTSGYAPDQGFFLGSPDGNYKLRIGFVGGYKIEPDYSKGSFQDRNEFFVLRPFMEGYVFKPWIRFNTTLDLVGNPPFLLSAYVELRPIRAFGLRAGLQSTPFSRHKAFHPQEILFPDWAVTAEYFWSGHDKGATVISLTDAEKVEGYLGIYSGTPLRQFTAVSGNYVVLARLTVSPLGPVGGTEYPYISQSPAPFRFSFTVQGYYGKITSGTENFDANSFQFTFVPNMNPTKKGTTGADLFLQGSRFVVFGEGYFQRIEPSDGSARYDAAGVWGQVGVLVVPRWVDVAVRGNWIDPSTSLTNVRTLIGEAQVAYYIHAPILVLKLRYGLADQQSPGVAALGPVVLPIEPGRSQVLTLQLNLAY
ncbi:MAG TPA: hypothetical protein VH853_19760 [Polyangia bacterium]|nr:hypothetical protein [Polyangia bacterium]